MRSLRLQLSDITTIITTTTNSNCTCRFPGACSV